MVQVIRDACVDRLRIESGSNGVTFTDGTNTVSNATQLTVTGGTIGGATPNATLAINSTPIIAKIVAKTSSNINTDFQDGSQSTHTDGVLLATGDVILLAYSSSINGVYIVNPTGAPSRAPFASTGTQLNGMLVTVIEGDNYSHSSFIIESSTENPEPIDDWPFFVYGPIATDIGFNAVPPLGISGVGYYQGKYDMAVAINGLPQGFLIIGQIDESGQAIQMNGDATITETGNLTIQAIQGNVVSGWTGSTNVVFSNAPTMVNPVVGTQSQGNNSTLAASTAYVDTGLATKATLAQARASVYLGI